MVTKDRNALLYHSVTVENFSQASAGGHNQRQFQKFEKNQQQTLYQFVYYQVFIEILAESMWILVLWKTAFMFEKCKSTVWLELKIVLWSVY